MWHQTRNDPRSWLLRAAAKIVTAVITATVSAVVAYWLPTKSLASLPAEPLHVLLISEQSTSRNALLRRHRIGCPGPTQCHSYAGRLDGHKGYVVQCWKQNVTLVGVAEFRAVHRLDKTRLVVRQ